MALNKAALKTAIVTAMTNATAVTDPSQQASAFDAYATTLSNAIDTFVKGGDVDGDCPSGGGPLVDGAMT